MRFSFLLVACIAFLAAPASAASIIVSIPIAGGGDQGPFDINGPTFDTMNGTLTSVQAVVTGQVTPKIAPSSPGYPIVYTGASYTFFFFEPGATYSGKLSEPAGDHSTFSFSLTFNPPAGAVFSSATGASSLIGEFGFGALASSGQASGQSDGTTFSGTINLTYGYQPAPEPAGLPVFALGVGAMAMAVRRRALWPFKSGVAT
jgi:hypothetical protein